MTDPADSDQLRNALSSQGATICRHEELLCGLMEGLQTLAESHDQALNTLLDQFLGLSTMQHTTKVTSQPLNNLAVSSAVTPVSREHHLPPPERFDGESLTYRAFLTQCSLIIKLQPSSFPSDRSKIAYLITLLSRREAARKLPAFAELPQCGRICCGFPHASRGARKSCSTRSCTDYQRK
jgi:hypothetical protein